MVFCAAGAAQAGTCPAGYHFNDFGNGAGFCAQDPSGGGTGGSTVSYGGGGTTPSYGEPMAPPVVKQPSTPVYAPAPVQAPPAAPRPAPYVAPKAPARQAPAYVAPVPVPAQVNVPATPAQGSNQPVKSVGPVENPVIAGVPVEAPATEAAPPETPTAATPSETASATPAPSQTVISATGLDVAQSASTHRFEPWPYMLSGLLIAAFVTVLVARARTGRRAPEAGHGGSMEAGSTDA